ncbi:hypothetical protein POTOM_000764 [Populus tomentosa]|uniref:Uncharacterized protein n=1 Tax=Populus tomentosa TaxID=118781 RepID=A0A8X8IUJ1_POPTO|nr:hypothetical protein POTOM_000764 [Populus tomentosa]
MIIQRAVALTHKWYDPDWWKFGDVKFMHCQFFKYVVKKSLYGEIDAISRALAQFIPVNRWSISRKYARDR